MQDTVDIEGILIGCQADVGLPVGPPQVERDAAQPREEARVLADAAGVLARGHVFDVMDAGLDAPVTAAGGGEDRRRGPSTADVIAGRVAASPAPGLGAEGVGGALDLHDASKVRGPGSGQVTGGAHADRARGVAAAVETGVGMPVHNRRRRRQMGHRPPPRRPMARDLHRQVVAAGGGRCNGFF